jgi:hypothetical protein
MVPPVDVLMNVLDSAVDERPIVSLGLGGVKRAPRTLTRTLSRKWERVRVRVYQPTVISV